MQSLVRFLNNWQARRLLPCLLSVFYCALLPTPTFAAPARQNAAKEPPWQVLSGADLKIEFMEQDREQARRLLPLLIHGRKTVTRFFHRPFPRPFPIRIYPDRAALTAYWRVAWNAPDFQSEPWMVASGAASMLAILSPAVWKTQAAEHDPADTRHVERLLAHEMVHVFHGQNNPHPELDGMDDLGWFVEGLAVYVSGQLADPGMAPAREAITSGKEPKTLANAWSGRYRYGVSGSIIDYIVTTYGRKKLDPMLQETSQNGLLQHLGLTEQELLERWRTFVVTAPHPLRTMHEADHH